MTVLAGAACESTHAKDNEQLPETKPQADRFIDEQPRAYRVGNVPNWEATVNILANLSEINFVTFGGGLFCTGGLLLFRKRKRKTGAVLMGCALLSIAFGIAIPNVCNWFISTW